MQAAVITDSARKAVVERSDELIARLTQHSTQGLDAHDQHAILDVPFLDSNGNTIASKTLKLGVLIDGSPAFVLIPAIP